MAEFIERAVDFANERLWGTLAATIIVHPRSLEDPAIREALDRTLSNLRYGVVSVNCIPGLAWAIATPPWGSYPGNEPWDIQSGIGFLHNTRMLPRSQKVVVQAPFRMWPRPIWFPSRAAAIAEVTRNVANFELEPSLWRLARTLWAAVRP